MAKHTEGQWQIGRRHPGRVVTRGVDRNKVIAFCTCPPEDSDTPNEEERGNAVLIAAAPDLLAACKSALELIKPTVFYGGETTKALEAAIAKAEGV